MSIIHSGNCGENGDNLTWTLTDQGLLTISGQGDMAGYSDTAADCVAFCQEDWPREKVFMLVLEEGVRSVGKLAFSRFTALRTVTLPDSLAEIGDMAFYGCSGLRSVALPAGLERLGWYAFGDCPSLEAFSVAPGNTNFIAEDGILLYDNRHLAAYPCGSPRSFYAIPEWTGSLTNETFSGCRALTSVTIPATVTSIGNEVFRNCTALTSVTIPKYVNRLGDGVFEGCTVLASVVLPACVKSIGDRAFDDCPQLVLTVERGSYAERYCQTNGLAYVCSDGLPAASPASGACGIYGGNLSWTLDKDGALTIYGRGAMADYASELPPWPRKKIRRVTLERGVTSIGDSAFSDCGNLNSVELPSTLTRIGDWAFSGCGALGSAVIPASVAEIGYDAFYECPHLVLCVPSGSAAEAYCCDNNISYMSYSRGESGSVAPAAEPAPEDPRCRVTSGICGDRGDNLTWTLDSEGVLTISGEGGMAEYFDPDEVPWFPDNVRILRLSEGVTAISRSTFADCVSLISVSLPDSLTALAEEAFYRCERLRSIDLPAGLTEIGDNAFCFCSALTSVTLPAGLTEIGSSAFCGCESLTSLTIPDSVTEIGYSAFDDCPDLVLTVTRGSYAESYCQEEGLSYTCLD